MGEIDTEDEDDSMADDDLELILLSLLVSKSTLVSIGRFSRFALVDSWLLAFFFSSLFKSLLFDRILLDLENRCY